MKYSEIDWSVIRGATILLAVSVLIAAAALVASYRFASKQEAGLQRARSMLISSRTQYQDLDEEEDIIARYLPRYSSLEQQGIIGREQRLDWIDVLRESARAVRVPRLQYVIEAQEKLDTGVDLRVGDYEVYSSQMRLDLGLLHEGDLVRLLARMHDSVSGLFGVSGCSMTREADPFKQAGDATNVQASCILNFITIRGPERAARAPS